MLNYALACLDLGMSLTPSGSIGFALGMILMFSPMFAAMGLISYWTRP